MSEMSVWGRARELGGGWSLMVEVVVVGLFLALFVVMGVVPLEHKHDDIVCVQLQGI